MKRNNISQQITSVIAHECGMKVATITNKTNFISGQEIPYFDCMAVLYTLQHKFGITLPESDFTKFTTVGRLKNYITKQLKQQTK